MDLKFMCILIISTLIYCDGYNYEIEILDEEVFSPCKAHPNNFIDRLHDLSELNMEFSENDSIQIVGNIRIATTVHKPLPLVAEVLKKDRGVWQVTPYTVKRPDYCLAIFDDSEIWYPFFQTVSKENRGCPFKEGTLWDINVVSNTKISLSTQNADKEYKIHLEVGDKSDMSSFVCAEVLVQLYNA